MTPYLQADEVDIICVSLDMAMASVGGFCAGKRAIIDHQRLSGLGYCFSASVPPMMASAAIEALNIMDSSAEMFSKLQGKILQMRKLLQQQLVKENTLLLSLNNNILGAKVWFYVATNSLL